MRTISRFLAGVLAGVVMTAGTGLVISAIAGQQTIDGIEVRRIIDLSTTANGKATLTGLEIHPLLGLALVIQLPTGVTTAHKIQVRALFDGTDPDQSDKSERDDNAVGKIVEIRSDPSNPQSAADNARRTLSSNEVTQGTVDYLVLVSPKFDDNAPDGLAIVDIVIQLST